MWYLDKNGDLSEVKTSGSIKLTDAQAQQVIDAKLSGLIASYENGELIFTEPKVEEPEIPEPELPTEPIIPTLLSRFQALTVLKLTKLEDGTTLYKATDDYINSLSDDSVENITAKTAWENAQEFRRNSALILNAQAMFKLTDAQVDEMFKLGAQITA